MYSIAIVKSSVYFVAQALDLFYSRVKLFWTGDVKPLANVAFMFVYFLCYLQSFLLWRCRKVCKIFQSILLTCAIILPWRRGNVCKCYVFVILLMVIQGNGRRFPLPSLYFPWLCCCGFGYRFCQLLLCSVVHGPMPGNFWDTACFVGILEFRLITFWRGQPIGWSTFQGGSSLGLVHFLRGSAWRLVHFPRGFILVDQSTFWGVQHGDWSTFQGVNPWNWDFQRVAHLLREKDLNTISFFFIFVVFLTVCL